MKKIELISVGQLKFKELREMEKMYSQKLNYFVQFNSRSSKEIKIADETTRVKKEALFLIQALQKNDYVIALDSSGRKMDSLRFASFLEEKLGQQTGRLVFLIGGFFGLSPILDSRINMKLSFSDMTFAHDIFRILFLEQLYRAFTIIKGITYHR
jgi:23S rRNA (pseudouridine1915-N3)-methyltransferase